MDLASRGKLRLAALNLGGPERVTLETKPPLTKACLEISGGDKVVYIASFWESCPFYG